MGSGTAARVYCLVSVYQINLRFNICTNFSLPDAALIGGRLLFVYLSFAFIAPAAIRMVELVLARGTIFFTLDLALVRRVLHSPE